MANESVNANSTTETVTNTEGQEVNVTLVDGVCVVTSADVTDSLTAPILIDKPAAGETVQIDVAPGQKYFFDFNENNVDAFVQDGNDLTLSFADGSAVVLKDFGTAASSALPATLAFSDALSADELEGLIQVVDTTPADDELQEPQAEVREVTGDAVASTDETDGEGEQVAAVEPAAGEPTAEQVAQIEPAAGEEPGGAENSGFTFSDPDITPVGPLAAVGPLDPTALQYGVEFQNDQIFPEEEIDDQPEVAGPQRHILDETNLNLTQTGTIDAEFGNDGPGVIIPGGGFSVSGSLLGGVLQSNGQPIDVQPTVDGYTGTINGGATTVFTLVIDPATGDYQYDQVLPFDHADGTNPNDVVQLTFGVIARDSDGDTAGTSIIIDVLDDAPVTADPDDESINENALSGGPITVGDTLNIDFGNDTPGTVVQNGANSASGDLAGGVLSSNGQPVDVQPTANGYVGTINGGATTVFELVITNAATGVYEFTLFEPLDHTATGTNIDLDFGVNVVDYDGDALGTTITIHIADSVPNINDKPVIGKGIETVDETNLPGVSVSGKLDIDFGTDLPASLTPNGTTSSSVPLTSNGTLVSVTQTATGYVGSTPAGDVFTLTIQPDGSYTFDLLGVLDHPDATNPDDPIQLVFGVVATDSDGDTDTGTITINVKDDGPDIVDPATQTVNEDAIVDTVNGNLSADFGADGQGEVEPTGSSSFSGVPTLTSNGQVVTVNATPTGYVGTSAAGDVFTLDINTLSGEYEFQLLAPLDHGAGDFITLNFGAQITDFDGDKDTATISIKVKDSGPEINDKPEAGKGIETVDETNLPGVSVSGKLDIDFGNDLPAALTPNGSTSSSVPLTSQGVPVTVTQTATGYAGSTPAGDVFTLTIQPDGSYTFDLLGVLDHPDTTDPDDPIQLVFGVVATDSDGDTDTGTITINVKDDGPLAVDDGNTVVQNTTTVNGNVLSNDDGGEDVVATVTNVRIGGTDYPVAAGVATVVPGVHGTLTINADGSYTYVSKGTNAVTVQDVFTYTLTDFDGDSDTAKLTINVVDVDDKPILADPDPLLVDETDLNPTDTDSDTVSANFGLDGPGTFVASGAGTFTFSGATNNTLTSNDVPVSVAVEGNDYVGRANGDEVFRLTLNNTSGEYEFILSDVLDHADPTNPDDIIELGFGVTARDVDGDTDTGTIVVQVKDDGPQANDDCNEFSVQATNKDFNIVLVLDVSGSMGGDKLTLLKSSVSNLLGDFNGYNGGEIKVHIVPFSANAQTGQTFTVTDDAGFNAATSFLNGLNAAGATNYEAPLASAINWLQGASANDPIANADTYSYFVSDGAPNRYLNTGGGVTSGSADTVMNEITGSDGSDEVALLQGLSTEVIGVGIGVNGTTLARLGQIDSDGTALDVQDPTDLDAALQGTNPLQGTATGNVITGENGGAGAADDLSEDVQNIVTKIAFNGTVVDVDPVNGATIDGDHGTLQINADGSYTYKVTDTQADNDIVEQFVYTLTDYDGDSREATLTLKGNVPLDIRTESLVVDETDLNPTDTDSGVVTGNFGQGVTADYDSNGTFTSSVALTSNGTAVNVAVVGNSYVGTAGGETIFTLALNAATGAYEFTLLGVLDHPDANNANDDIVLNFGVTATGSDGDVDSGSIKVTVLDDGPVAVSDSGTVAQNANSVSGNVLANDDGGEDVPATVTNVRIGGTDYPVVAGVATVVPGTHGTLTINADGSYNYVSNGTNTTAVQDVFTYTLTDFDGDSDTAQLKINIADVDDKPDFAGSTVTVDETDLNPTDDASSSVSGNFGADAPGTFELTGAGSVSFTGAENNQLTSGGVPVAISVVGNSYVGTAGTETVFTLDLNQTTGAYTFTLIGTLDHADETNPDDVVQLKFGVTAKDSDGDTDSGFITVNVKDDGPVAVADSDTVTQGQSTITGNVLANDDGGEDAPASVTNVRIGGTDYPVVAGTPSVVAGAHGTLNINADGSYTYVSNGANQTAVNDIFTYTLTDFDGDSDTAELNIRVSDVDTRPEVGPTEVTVDETDLNPTDTASNIVDGNFGGDGPGTYALTGAGSFGFMGAENNQLTSGGVPVAVTLVGNSYVGKAGGETIFTLELNQTTGAYTFTLLGTLDHADATNPDDVIKLTFGVTAEDSDGDTDTGMITVNVKDDGPVAVADSGLVDQGQSTINGNVLANDDSGEDVPASVISVSFGGNDIPVVAGTPTVVDGQYGTLSINADGSYTYVSNNTNTAEVQDVFGYTMADYDGDPDSATLTITVADVPELFIVGDNVDDVDGQTTPWVVGGGDEAILGGAGADVLVGDAGGSQIVNQGQDYNFVYILDTSGSMGANDANDGVTSRIELLIAAVKNQMNQFGSYQNGQIKAHIVEFSTNVKSTFTVDFSSPTALADVTAYLDGLDGNGLTNYESPLQAANSWLAGNEPLGGDAITTTYFISDGQPNRYVDDQGTVLNPPGDNIEEDAIIQAEITGTSVTTSDGTFGDNTDEVGTLKALSDDVVAVGVNVPNNANLNLIDSDATATYIDDATDLDAVLAGNNPLNLLGSVGDDDIDGGDRSDLIFGDALNTDALADAQGLSTNDGAGFEVFQRLENGEGSSAGWSRADTINYIRANAEDLAAESVNSEGQGRTGGNDEIDGGAGDDVIFGQEGDDRITGGAGDDTLYGGSGEDSFIFEAIADGVDTVKDFDLGEGDVLDVSALLNGYDALQDSINDFVFTTEVAGDTVVSVDANGSGNAANATQIAVLEAVTGLDIELATNNGETTV